MVGQDRFFAILFVLAGLFSALGGYLNWNWFMESRKARWLVALIGRNGARVFYILMGLVISGFGVAAFLGLVELD